MSDCVNLLTTFGDRYQITYDPAYTPPRDKNARDPWYMVIPCQRGAIYPQGGTRLVVEVDGRPTTIKRLKALNCVTLKQHGDHFASFTFDVTDFDQIAAVVMPRRRRVASEKHRQHLLALSRQHSPFLAPSASSVDCAGS